MTSRSTLVAVVALGLAAAVPARAAFHVTVVPPEQWGAPDAALGLAGGTVEDFEDVRLAPGLLVELSAPDGTFTGAAAAALPAVFDPVDGDPYGDAFIIGVWDGTHVLVNTPTNQSVDYGTIDFPRVRLHVPGGASRLGFSLQQLTGNQGLEVNGVSLGRVAGLGLTPAPGRNGYLIVSSDDPADPVTSVACGGGGDAFVIDHVAYLPAGSVPVRSATWSAVKALFR